ncbi:MAG: class I SAM-dependent methyltransferase [Chloroflexi bacterium]|nr:class I SAM-dependent methyltransferase [Chloroflexota bacterium]
MNPDNPDQMEMFSREWYNEYFRRAASSKAHSLFCEKVYGKDLYQHGLMHMRELDLLVSLIKPGSKILEIGCSNGYITEYIHDRTGATILGLDFSDVAIEQARQRTADKSDSLQFERVDLTQEEIPGTGYDYIILIDSIYFLGDFAEALKRFGERLNDTGQMVISVFQVKDEEDPDEILLPDNTLLAQALDQLEFSYTWHDFTAEVRAHGIENYCVGEELKEALVAEGNEFLYNARAGENRFFKESAEREAIVRFMYLVERGRSA